MAYLGREAAKAPIVTSDLPNDGVTLAKMAGGTDGQIITYDASGNPVAVGPGTAGQVLKSAGAGAPPGFGTGFDPDAAQVFNESGADVDLIPAITFPTASEIYGESNV